MRLELDTYVAFGVNLKMFNGYYNLNKELGLHEHYDLWWEFFSYDNGGSDMGVEVYFSGFDGAKVQHVFLCIKESLLTSSFYEPVELPEVFELRSDWCKKLHKAVELLRLDPEDYKPKWYAFSCVTD